MALEVKSVVAGYTHDNPILNGINFRAEDGKVTIVLGPNGAGKSTLLKTIYGYLRPRSGEILANGENIADIPPNLMLGKGIAYLLQGSSTFPSMTVEENIWLGGWNHRADKALVRRSMDEVYSRFPKLASKRKTVAGLMSGGEQRLLEIARLTVTSPSILLLDEPSVGLMPSLVDEIYGEISNLKSNGFTIIMVDQNIRKAIEIADYVYSFKLGRNDHEGSKAYFEENLPSIVKEWL